jgi:peptide/nickel transport system substrate-binding protein
MQRFPLVRALVPGALIASLLALAACGGGNDNNKSKGASGAPTAGKKGGNLTVLYAADVDYMDPGAAYYQYSFNVQYATQRPLYSYKPDDPLRPQPDLASGQPQISDGGKTVTVKIRSGVKFSPPVNRAVTSKDVKYAIERSFTSNVASGYATAYFGDLVGLKETPKPGTDVPGIQTPDDQTIVFKLSKPSGGVLAGALVLPGSAPVPREYALPFDKKTPSAYATHVVATGPYMVKNDAKGNLVGWKPTRLIQLVRNPNWSKSTDYKPAYLDTITIKEGNGDAALASRQILNSQSTVQGDFQIPPDVLKSLVTGPKKKQLIVTPPTGRVRYVALNTKIKPFDNINVRKAISAAIDRNAMRLAFGGPVAGLTPTHFLTPGEPGYDEAGGAAGPGVDYLKSPSGDMQLAQSYMKKAGYPSGKYTGSEKFLMVSDNASNQVKAAQVALANIEALGFKVNFRSVVRSTMYTKFCSVPKAKVAICPSVGWLKDFADAQTMLDPTFNGKNILPTNNSNWPQLDDPKINAAMDKAETIVPPQERAKAWGAIDKMITEAAPAVPWLWDKQPNVESTNVNGVINSANATWDFMFTSLK